VTGLPAFSVTLADIADIVATAVLIYYVLLLIRGTRGVRIGMGVAILLLLLLGADQLHLVLLTTLLQFILLGTAVTLPIVFQPELRRVLEQLGRGAGFGRGQTGEAESEAALATLAKAAILLSRDRIGALIAIERSTGLRDLVESGTRLDAKLSLPLLLTIFSERTPLHDGAVIIKEGCVEAAGCFLPLSENVRTDAHVGTRHRAALGLSEQSDAVVLVVSEQSGGISVAREGRLSREIDDEDRLRRVLAACCRTAGPARGAEVGGRKTTLRQALSGIGLKALSLSLAFAAWAYVRFAGNSMIAAFVDRHLRSLTTCVK
jgi:diadenylate cyclase